MPTKPITPKDAVALKQKQLPDAIIDAFNELIAENFDGQGSTFRQEAVVKRIKEKGINEADIFKNHYLDIETIFKKAGWKVVYDGPGYNESYPATFTFTKK